MIQRGGFAAFFHPHQVIELNQLIGVGPYIHGGYVGRGVPVLTVKLAYHKILFLIPEEITVPLSA